MVADTSPRQANKSTTALFSIRLHFVRKERIGIVQISASQFLTPRLLRARAASVAPASAAAPFSLDLPGHAPTVRCAKRGTRPIMDNAMKCPACHSEHAYQDRG